MPFYGQTGFPLSAAVCLQGVEDSGFYMNSSVRERTPRRGSESAACGPVQGSTLETTAVKVQLGSEFTPHGSGHRQIRSRGVGCDWWAPSSTSRQPRWTEAEVPKALEGWRAPPAAHSRDGAKHICARSAVKGPKSCPSEATFWDIDVKLFIKK